MMPSWVCFINYSINEAISSMIKTKRAWLINFMFMVKYTRKQ